MTNKSYMEKMMEQEKVYVKVGNEYFAGYAENKRFKFSSDENQAYQIITKDELVATAVVLNAEYGNDNVKLYHLVDNAMEPLVVYNNFIKAEMQISADRWGEAFNQIFKEFILNTRFKINFTVDGIKYWVKEVIDNNFIVTNLEDFYKIMTTDENEAGNFSIGEFRNRKEVSPKEVSDKVLDIISTAEFVPHNIEYDKFANEVFQFMFHKELDKQISEEKESRKEKI